MEALILHAGRDEARAAAFGVALGRSDAGLAPYTLAKGVEFGGRIVLIPVWSANAAQEGHGAAITALAERRNGRILVVALDSTPLPPLPATTLTARADESERSLQSKLRLAQDRLDRSSPRRTRPASTREDGARGLGVGMGMGLAIYAGMFVAAGAWKSDEVSIAVDTGRAPQVVQGALRTFQTAFGEDRYRVATAATGQFTPVYHASVAAANVVPVRAGFNIEDAYADGLHGRSSGVAPSGAALAPGLAAAGVSSLGFASTGGFASVSVNGNDAF